MPIDPIQINPISENRFNLFTLFTRQPFVKVIAKEMEHYSNIQTTILGVILLDLVDVDFSYVLLARDKNRQFRALDVKVNFSTIDEARRRMLDSMRWKILHREDSIHWDVEKIGLKLFDLRIDKKNIHPYFNSLKNGVQFTASKNTIVEVSNHFKDIDGNFIKDFQSINGFDARLWEIYLFAALVEQEFEIIREFDRPDFLIKKYGVEVGVEAVTVGRNIDNPPKNININQFERFLNVKSKLKNETPLRFSSSLYSKVKKKYWELPHMRGKPLVIAIADFHDDSSMVWSFSALVEYLYGKEDGSERAYNSASQMSPYGSYQKANGTEIQSGFFFHKDTENISGVLFSATGTVAKFTRMGVQAGFGLENQVIKRFGVQIDPNPESIGVKSFLYTVDQNGNELWSEGLNLFHNPNAKIKLDNSLFSYIANHQFKEGRLESVIPEFHPFSSMNINFTIRG